MNISETYAVIGATPLLTSGRALVDIYSGGVATGVFSEIGNTTSFELAYDGAESLQIKGRNVTNFRQNLVDIALPGSATLSIGLNMLTPAGLAVQFLSTGAAAITQASATGQTATVTLVENQWVKIVSGKYLFSGVTIATKTEGTDFQVDYSNGMIMALNSGAAGSKTVGYSLLDLGADARIIVAGSKPSGVLCSVKYVGQRLDTGAWAEIIVPKVNLLPEGGVNFANIEEQEVTFTGNPVQTAITTPSGTVNGFFVMRDLPE